MVKNICGVFSETVLLQRSSAPSLDGHTSGWPVFLQRTSMHVEFLSFSNKDPSQCDAPYAIAISSSFVLALR